MKNCNILPTLKKIRERKKFMKYSFIAWTTPILYVTACVILSKTRVLNVGYGESAALNSQW